MSKAGIHINGVPINDARAVLVLHQMELVYSLVHGVPFSAGPFEILEPFRGVFPVDPWKPDARQIAQQALFLCAADVDQPFMENMGWHSMPPGQDVLFQLVVPTSLKERISVGSQR